VEEARFYRGGGAICDYAVIDAGAEGGRQAGYVRALGTRISALCL
jgi:hypothetical protein